MSKVETLKIRPYARLLTMLGEQLIKNERIALIELIKNSYDADAPWVKVSFNEFGDNFEINKNSKLIIEDSGIGMTESIIKNHWLNPATPEKKRRKAIKATTAKGRVIQGEKGIGRFAILKLGKKIEVVTRTAGDPFEHVIQYDFTRYDDDFLAIEGNAQELFLDDLTVTYHKRSPQTIIEKEIQFGVENKKIRPAFGTQIEISHLKGGWSDKKAKEVHGDLARLQFIFEDIDSANSPNLADDFQVLIYKDEVKKDYDSEYIEKLRRLMNDKSILKVTDGQFSVENKEFTFKLDGVPQKFKLNDPYLTGLKVFSERFGNAGNLLNSREIECGPFSFGFYVFDLNAQASPKYKIDVEDKKLLKSHRIYLYRDGIRVYPYGEPEDDWLRIDVMRGTISAGSFLSNDQVVGFVNITQAGNPKLRDKTNREGLIEEGEATQDFITLIQAILFYLRHNQYAKYLANLDNKKSQDIFNKGQVQQRFDELTKIVKDNRQAKELVDQAAREYKAEREYLTRRAETTEELAGVGLSVETASHDIMSIMSKVFANLDGLIKDLISANSYSKDYVVKELQSIRGGLTFVKDQLQDIQVLFKSSKQKRKLIRIQDVIEKVERIYKQLLLKQKITLKITPIGSPLVAKTTDAVLLQLLLNLIDNSVYWLSQINKQEKMIEIVLDGNNGSMIFSDNGPGINKDDAPYIFEPFFTGKGEDGRGLGLYIARQLLERNDYSIHLADLKSQKILDGANFVVNFVSEES